MTKYPIVSVRWTDAHTTDAWRSIEEALEDEPAFVTTVGFLLEDSKKRVLVASTLSADELISSTMEIPKGMVVKITKLRGK